MPENTDVLGSMLLTQDAKSIENFSQGLVPHPKKPQELDHDCSSSLAWKLRYNSGNLLNTGMACIAKPTNWMENQLKIWTQWIQKIYQDIQLHCSRKSNCSNVTSSLLRFLQWFLFGYMDAFREGKLQDFKHWNALIKPLLTL